MKEYRLKMAKLGVLGYLANTAMGLKSRQDDMCMMSLDDRLDCVLDPMITRDECMRRECCYDSNVPEGVPHCYFALEADQTDVLEAEMNAKPLSTVAGVYQSNSVELPVLPDYLKKDSYEEPSTNINDASPELAFLQAAKIETCNISQSEMTRCGRRGVPKRRCLDLGCCWNPKWRPGGDFGPRCHKPGLMILGDDEHSYANGKMEKIESMAEARSLPIQLEEDNTHTDIKFLSDNLNSKVEKLKEEGCKPNHNQLQCIQGVTERLKCDISEALNMGIEACTACLQAGCCFDPEPKILAGMIYPICFEYGPMASDLPSDWNLDPTEEIPEKSVSDEDFNKMLDILESSEVKTTMEPATTTALPLTEEEKERKLRWQRWQEIQGLGLETEDSDVSNGNFMPNPESIVVFPGHNGQPTGDNFRQQQKDLAILGNMLPQESPNRSEAVKNLLSSINPAYAQYIDDNGSLKLNPLDSSDSDWNAVNSAEASQSLWDTIKNSQKTGDAKSPLELIPSATPDSVLETVARTTTTPATEAPTFAPTTTTTRSSIVTRPTMESSIQAFKKQMVEQQVQAEKNRLQREGYSEPQLSLELAKKRRVIEAQFGLTPPPPTTPAVPAPTPASTSRPNFTTKTFSNKYQEVEFRLQNARQVLMSQGYSGPALEHELEKHRRQIEASLGLTTPTPPTTTSTTTPRPQTTTPPFSPAAHGDPSSGTCFPQQCGRPSELNANLKKIVGGGESGNIKYWPWQASLRRSFSDDPNFSHLCGATLISDSWILTAAHCFIRYRQRMKIDVRMMETDSSKYLVHLGRYTKNQFEYNMQPRALKYFISHPDFKPYIGNQMHDIAVAKLHRPVVINDYVKPVCLPEFIPPVDGKIYITGWGSTKRVGPSANNLKELVLPLATQRVCEDQWKGYFNAGWICTDPGFLEDACQGDSGGPAVYFDQFQNHFSIVGVTIAGSETCSTSRATVKAGVYSNVLYYKEFINRATSNGCR